MTEELPTFPDSSATVTPLLAVDDLTRSMSFWVGRSRARRDGVTAVAGGVSSRQLRCEECRSPGEPTSRT